jgi:acetyl esterase/lipase
VFRTEVAPRAVYFDIHGGGMMLGSARLNDLQNAERAERLGFAAVSVDYRLAPEHPFPAGADDCLAVAKWLIEQAESEFGTAQLLIGGESAGAYYAALTLLRVRDELGSVDRFRAANLVFGAYDLSRTPSQRGTRPFSGFDILTPDGIEFFHDSYLPGRTPEERRSPAISPLYAELHDLPPAIFTVGTDDHLLDDSLFMATRWAAHGNATELAVFPDCCHGFSMFPTSLAKRARERVDAFLERCISDPA